MFYHYFAILLIPTVIPAPNGNFYSPYDDAPTWSSSDMVIDSSRANWEDQTSSRPDWDSGSDSSTIASPDSVDSGNSLTADDCGLPDDSCATVWAEPECSGDGFYYDTSDNWTDLMRMDNKVKSLYVRDGCTLTLWENKNFKGNKMDFQSGYNPVNMTQMKSLKCKC